MLFLFIILFFEISGVPEPKTGTPLLQTVAPQPQKFICFSTSVVAHG
jgi:hypothetical protein